MSAAALQRVVVRMLYDPALVEAVYTDAAGALADVALTAEQRAWLVAPDRRRWRADPHRRARTLQALLEEYPAAGARVARRDGLGALDAFFSTAGFHRCVQVRGSLAEAFGDFLGARGTAVAGVARVEQGIARVRRAPPCPAGGAPDDGARRPARPAGGAPGDGPWRAAPWIDAFLAPAGALADRQAVVAALVAHPEGTLAGLVDPTVRLPAPPPAAPEAGFLVERDAAGAVAVGDCSPALARLLAHRAPRDWPALRAALWDLGAEGDEAAEVAADLLADGLLVRGRVGAPATP